MAGTINFKKVMEARKQAQQAEAEKAQSEAPVAYVDPEATLSVRSFTAEGIAHVTDLLRKMRIEETVLQDEVDELVNDIEYSRQLDENIKINPDKVFATKLELCEYFTKIFTADFLAEHRRDKGLWTWLAMAYFKQFVKAKNNVLEIASDARWIYAGSNYRLVRRHFIAGALYLYVDIKDCGTTTIDMLMGSAPVEFGRMIDALTTVEDSIRNPAFLAVAAKLYYDADAKSHYKKGATDQGKPGSVRQLTRLFKQYGLTYDFIDSTDVEEIYEMLPGQFDRFKGSNR